MKSGRDSAVTAAGSRLTGGFGESVSRHVVRLSERVAVDAVAGSSVREDGWVCLNADRLGGEIFAGSRPKS